MAATEATELVPMTAIAAVSRVSSWGEMEETEKGFRVRLVRVGNGLGLIDVILKIKSPSSRQKLKSSVAGLTLTGYLEFGITKGGGKYGNEGLSFGNGEVVESDKAVVVADDARCSKTGVSILGQGGHAVDAAVATALCLGVVNAMSSGIGGGVVESDKAVVAADDARCSKTGVSILGQGGHAVDAAVATALCLGVVNAMASGIGGGGFMVVRSSATSRTKAINMRRLLL
ncbi:hypothetical protein AgCh_026077 [Apium graveolens]